VWAYMGVNLKLRAEFTVYETVECRYTVHTVLNLEIKYK
jgi:hypothetical protein